MAKKILIIEDEDNLRENLTEILSFRGYDIVTAVNGKEGVIKANKEKPDLILCDIMMPEMDGYEVVEYVRENKQLTNIPFIFLTAKTEKKDTRKGMALGADDYLTKPFSSEEIAEAIEARFQRAGKMKDEMNEKVSQYIKQINDTSQHEFNTPLNGILGLSELLLINFEEFNHTDIKRIIKEINTAGTRLHRTLDNILYFQYLENLKGKKSQFDKNKELKLKFNKSTIEEIISKVKEKYTKQCLVEITVEECYLHIRDEHLNKILCELLDNACKFSHEESEVIFRGFQDDNTYQIQITNTGREFKKEHIENIGPFSQFERSKYEQQGSGLGLYIAKTLTELYAGNMEIETVQDGKTIINIQFPLY